MDSTCESYTEENCNKAIYENIFKLIKYKNITYKMDKNFKKALKV